MQDADDFADLYKESWKFDVEGLAKTQLDQTKWNAPQKTEARLECPERKPVTFKMERACQSIADTAGEVSRMPPSVFYV